MAYEYDELYDGASEQTLTMLDDSAYVGTYYAEYSEGDE